MPDHDGYCNTCWCHLVESDDGSDLCASCRGAAVGGLIQQAPFLAMNVEPTLPRAAHGNVA